LRKAADLGNADACKNIARDMYADIPHAREAGLVGEAAGAVTSAGAMEGHCVPPDVLTDVLHWLLQASMTEPLLRPFAELDRLRTMALEGCTYCYNAGCGVLGQLKDFKRCPQCKTARYCGDACQKQDWNAGGHKAACGTFKGNQKSRVPAPARDSVRWRTTVLQR